MQIFIDGVAIDTYNKDISIERTNNFLVRDKKYARSLKLKMPKTEKNNGIFATGAYPLGAVCGLREFSCSITLDGWNSDGSLVIVSEEAQEYEVMLVIKSDFDEFLAALMRDEYNGTDYTWTNHSGVTNTNVQFGQRGYSNDLPPYAQAGWAIMPSFDILAALGSNKHGISIQHNSLGADTLYYILKDVLIGGAANVQVNMNAEGVSLIVVSTDKLQTAEFTNGFYRFSGLQNEWIGGQATALQPLVDMEVTFPNDFPSNLFFLDAPTEENIIPFPGQGYKGQFYGGYSFDTTGASYQVYGTPLAGKTITIEKDKLYVIAEKDFYINSFDEYMSNYYCGWSSETFTPSFAGGGVVRFSIKFITDEKMQDMYQSQPISLVNQFDKLKVKDLIDIVADATGTNYSYDAQTKTLTFEPFSISAAKKYTLQNVVSVGKVNFGYLDFAQNTAMRFKSEEYVTNPLINNYTIANPNLSAEQTIEIPVSEGNATNTGALLLDDIENDNGVAKIKAKEPSIGYAVDGQPMSRIAPFGVNMYYSLVTNAMKQVEVTAVVDDIWQIDENTLISVEGVLFVWTKIQGSGNTWKFTLHKI